MCSPRKGLNVVSDTSACFDNPGLCCAIQCHKVNVVCTAKKTQLAQRFSHAGIMHIELSSQQYGGQI